VWHWLFIYFLTWTCYMYVTMILYSWILVSLDTLEALYTWNLVHLNFWVSCVVSHVPCSCCLWLYNITIDNIHNVGELISSNLFSYLWWPYSVTHGRILEGSHRGHQWFCRVYWHPYVSFSFSATRYAPAPRPILMGSAIPYSYLASSPDF